MRRLLAAAGAALLAAGLWSCASAPPPPPPPEPAPAPEPEPAVPTVELSWIVPKTVNVRETPSTNAPTVAKAAKGTRLTSFEEKEGWVRVKLPDKRVGWVRKDLLKRDDGCLPDRKEVLLTPPMLHMSEASGATGAAAKGKIVVEADIDESGKVKSVRVVTNETGSPERAEMAKSEVQGVTFQPPVKRCRVTGFTYVYTRTF